MNALEVVPAVLSTLAFLLVPGALVGVIVGGLAGLVAGWSTRGSDEEKARAARGSVSLRG